MMDFYGYDYATESVKKRLEKFKIWHNRFFKPLKKPFRGDMMIDTPRNRNGIKKYVYKMVTAIGTYFGNGTIQSTAIEQAMFHFEIAFIQWQKERRKKRLIRREKKASRKIKIMRLVPKGLRKFRV